MLKKDYSYISSPESAVSRHSPIRILLISFAVLLFILAALLGPSEKAEATRQPSLSLPLPSSAPNLNPIESDHTTAKITRQLDPHINSLPEQSIKSNPETSSYGSMEQAIESVVQERYTIKSGDNLSTIFNKMGISAAELITLMRSDRNNGAHLHRIRPGQQLEFLILGDHLQGLRYITSKTQLIDYERIENEFIVHKQIKETKRKTSSAQGTISGSLYKSAIKAGLSDGLIMELVSIFGWDIDFALDIRKGDMFTVVYDEIFLDGEKLKDGKILAAEFTNRNNLYQAIYFEDPQGNSNYFTPGGYSMRKAFIRSPVDFRRISSRFSKERFHPVLGKKRPHRGVDYASPTGTPIKASGDGKVIFRGKKGGYGKTVMIQHGGKFTTLYAHMSRFKRGVTKDKRVKQGDIIGYVGSTGVATGPHLHYEFRVNGQHRNPLTVKFPNASPVPKKYREDFKDISHQMMALLDGAKQEVDSGVIALSHAR